MKIVRRKTNYWNQPYSYLLIGSFKLPLDYIAFRLLYRNFFKPKTVKKKTVRYVLYRANTSKDNKPLKFKGY